ncbi:Tim44 domain-containing protein [Methylocapsa aurea]|uniref:Tim44 domain-containing protein n=1 Tax=Methylocapsa aurea TaxID=663610 RepID=UPI00055DE33C|nr:TIM44-like domain-containing protein [Methylocapsa aurea]
MAFRRKTLILTLAGMLAFGLSADAFARAGSGGSSGSRGSRTFSAPPATTTAPRGAAPMERSMTSPSQGFSRPGATAPGGGFFSGGFGRGLLGGLVGAGLFGMLFGNGMFGGLGGGMSILGLILQIGLLFLLFKLVMGFIRSRRAAVPGGGSAHSFAQSGTGGGFGGLGGLGSGLGGLGSGLSGAASGVGGGAARKLDVGQADFNMFEQRLASIEQAYGAEDLNALRSLASPEMASYFAEEIAANAKKGVVNKLSDVTFLQGDLSEAWREDNGEYASVAIRFSLIDTMVDRATGKIVSGDPSTPQQATELWTFARRPGGAPSDWKLSAIQQA